MALFQKRKGAVMFKLSCNACWLTAFALMPASTVAEAQHNPFEVSIPFNAANFSDPLTIKNDYFPLLGGTTYTYKAAWARGCDVDVTAVTYDTRVIDGITTRLVHHQVFVSDSSCTTAPAALDELTRDYYAQDNAGNVWHMGHQKFDCEGGDHCSPSARSWWIAGEDDVKPGIIMLAKPQSGKFYKQDFGKRVTEGLSVVIADKQSPKMTRDDAYRDAYSNCVVIKESSPIEETLRKTYCFGIGNVLVESGPSRSELTSISGTMESMRFRRPPHP